MKALQIYGIKLPLTAKIDAIEIHPVHEIQPGVWEPCEESEAQEWSVYAHYTTGGIDCIADCKHRQQAHDLKEVIEKIANNWQPC